jgi:hypothetical protein
MLVLGEALWGETTEDTSYLEEGWNIAREDEDKEEEGIKYAETDSSESTLEEEKEGEEEEEDTQQFKPVSIGAPLRLCINFRKCKYCLCHCCFEITSNSREGQEATSPRGHKKEQGENRRRR